MNNLLQTNIDDIRTEIMRLEDAREFDQKAWANVLMRLAGHPTRRADAARRMETAKHNQPMRVRTDLGMGGEEIELTLVPVAVETEPAW